MLEENKEGWTCNQCGHEFNTDKMNLAFVNHHTDKLWRELAPAPGYPETGPVCCKCDRWNQGTMMNPQDILVALCKYKEDRIWHEAMAFGHDPKKVVEHLYFTDDDERDLLSWPRKKAVSIVAHMKIQLRAYYDTASNFDPVNDTTICPWCIAHYPRCEECEYGKRHGICTGDHDEPADYKFITGKGAYESIVLDILSVCDIDIMKQILRA